MLTKLPLDSSSARLWWFTTTAKTPESAHLKTSQNKVARICVSRTSSC